VTTPVDPFVAALSRFADYTRLSNVPKSTAERAREIVRSCLVAGSSASVSEQGREISAILAGIEDALFGVPQSRSRSRVVAFHSDCLALAMPALDSVPDGLAAIVFPAVVAATELADVPEASAGVTMLDGLIVGMEIGLRLAGGIQTRRPSSGWNVATAVGRAAAATAVVKVLGGGEREFHQAIGLGATQAAGLAPTADSPARALIVGKAASDGFEAGVLAMSDWDGPAHPLDGRRGLFHLLTGEPAPSAVCDDLGRTWLLDTATSQLADHADESTRNAVEARIDEAGSIELLTGAHIVALLGNGSMELGSSSDRSHVQDIQPMG